MSRYYLYVQSQSQILRVHSTSKHFLKSVLLSISEFNEKISCFASWISLDLSYHAGEKGLWICGGFGLIGGVGTLISPWSLGLCWLEGGLPREDVVWGLGTATRSGPVTDRFVATRGGLCASDKLSDKRDTPPSDKRDVSDNLEILSANWWCGWWSKVSWGCNLGGGKLRVSGNLKWKFTSS